MLNWLQKENFVILLIMTPLEDFNELRSSEWEELAASKPTNAGTPKSGKYLVEDAKIKEVTEEQRSFELIYSNPEEAKQMQARLKARAGESVRVLTDKSKPNSIFIGPNN